MPSSPAQLFAQRLQAAMQDAGLPHKPSALQAQFNAHYDGAPISWQTARSWLQGGFLPQPDKIQALAELLSVSPEHLLFGKTAPEGADQPGKSLSVGDRAMWSHYLSIDEPARLLLRQVAAYMAGMPEHSDVLQRADEIIEKILQISRHDKPSEENISRHHALRHVLLPEAKRMQNELEERIKGMQDAVQALKSKLEYIEGAMAEGEDAASLNEAMADGIQNGLPPNPDTRERPPPPKRPRI